MGYVPGFKYDIFISYAHLDNEKHFNRPGWVELFEKELCMELHSKVDAGVKVFRDRRLSGFEEFDKQLAEALDASAVCICLISPRYIKAPWCVWEMRSFQECGRMGRLLKVVISSIKDKSSPLEAQKLLAATAKLLEHRFYSEDESSDAINELRPNIDDKDIPEFMEKIGAICRDLEKIFKRLRKEVASGFIVVKPPKLLPNLWPTTRCWQSPLAKIRKDPPAPPPITPPAPTPTPIPSPNPAPAGQAIVVYLAETTRDLAEQYKQVKSELRQFNCRVLPEQPLPENAEAFAAAVQQCLAQAKLSVHLVGKNYGDVLGDEERSTLHVQYALAAALAKANKLSQLVWMPKEITPKVGSELERFVNEINSNSTDFLRDKLEDLKTMIQQKLKPPADDSGGDELDRPVNVSLLYHENDFKAIKALYRHLELKESFNVRRPLKERALPEKYKQLLQTSDAVLVYYGAGDEDWFKNIWRQAQKLSSTGHPQPLLAIYLGQEETEDKDLLVPDTPPTCDDTLPLVLQNYQDFSPETIKPFINCIRSKRGGGR